MILLAACGEPPPPFEVIDVEPAPDSEVTAATTVALTFSEAVDPTTCTAETLHLVRLGPQGQAGWRADVVVVPDGEARVLLDHDGLAPGAWRVAVQTGVDGCLSAFGVGIRPFTADFAVVEAGSSGDG